MKIPIYITFLFSLSLTAQAQFSHIQFGDLTQTSYFSLDGHSLFYSNSISTKTLRTFYGNNYIDNETKESVSYRRPISAISDIHAGIQYIWLPDTQKSRLGVYAYAGTRHMRGGLIAPAFYELAMFGNSRFAGEFANLSNSRFLSADYQKLSLGIAVRLSSDSSRSFAAIHVAPVKGQRYMEGETASTYFYTSETGELLSLQAQALYLSSDQSHRRNQDFAGTGYAIGAMLYIHNPARNFWVYTSINDIGSVKWKYKSYRTHIDTSIYFSGIFIDNVFSFDSSLLHLSSDTLKKILETYTDTLPFRRSLPESFYLESGKYFPSCKLTVSGSLHYISRTGMPLPRIQAGISYKLNDYFQPYLSFSHGGAGRFAFGGGISSTPFKGFSFHICTPDLLAYTIPARSYANGVWLKISYKM